MTVEPPIVTDPVQDMGIELQDRFGNRHWVPLAEVVRMVMEVAAAVIREEESEF
jgi:hypothetical protein